MRALPISLPGFALTAHSPLSLHSLVDASMVPFQECYYLIIIQGLLILGGNTAFPVL